MNKEEWKDIHGYEGLYQASSMGLIRKLLDGNENKVLKLTKDSYGYLNCGLTKNKESKTKRVHSLVAIAFLNHRPNGMKGKIIDHINNIKDDNRSVNLQLTSQRVNTSKDRKNTVSKYIGVAWNARDNKWQAYINIGNAINLGQFTNEIKASEMYKLALNNVDRYTGNKKEFREYLRNQPRQQVTN